MTICNEVKLTVPEIFELYRSLYNAPGMITGLPGEFLLFKKNWEESTIYKLPSGYLRIQPDRLTALAKVHGIFFSNPYKTRELIQNMLYYYLDKESWCNGLICDLPEHSRGLHHFLKSLDLPSEEVSKNRYLLRRKK